MSITVSSLNNGLRIVSKNVPTVETVSISAWINVGARDESKETNGISHVLEHMAFKGTKKRTAFDIASEIEAVGGHLNAYTSRENTSYYAKVMKKDAALVIDIIGDIIQNSIMDENELAREKAVIIQEIKQTNDTPDDIIFDHLQNQAYPNQSMGRPILGSKKLVQKITPEALIQCMKKFYCPSQIIVAAAGNIKHEALEMLVRKSLGTLQRQPKKIRKRAIYDGGTYIEHREIEQVHLLIGLEGVSYHDDDYYAASALATLLGGGMSSRLFQEIREKKGLAYSVYSFLSCYSDNGLFGIYAGTSNADVPTIVPMIQTELKKIIDLISKKELYRTRAQLKAGILMSLESTSAQCEQLARHLYLYGKPISSSKLIKAIDRVDIPSIQKVAERIFFSKPTQISIGPSKGVEKAFRLNT